VEYEEEDVRDDVDKEEDLSQHGWGWTEYEKKNFNNFIPDIHSNLLSKTYLINNGVSLWEPMPHEARHVPSGHT
jgi:hypothetical protein